MREDRERGYNVHTSAGCGRGSSEAGQNRQLERSTSRQAAAEVAGLADEVEIEAAPGVLTIRPSAQPRAGWAVAASSFQPEGLIDEMSATRFDAEEWTW